MTYDVCSPKEVSTGLNPTFLQLIRRILDPAALFGRNTVKKMKKYKENRIQVLAFTIHQASKKN